MQLIDFIKSKRQQILQIAASHGARNVRVFGSVARGQDDEKSDIDFLVEMDKNSTLLDHAALLDDLERLLGRAVDVAPDDCLRERAKQRILQEAVAL